MVAGFADNAGSAMLATSARIGAAPQIKACKPAAEGESSYSSTDAVLAPSDLVFEPSRHPEHVTRGDLKAHFLCIKDIG